MRQLLPWITALVIVALDRVSKMLVMEHIEPLNPSTWIEVLPGLTLTHIRNSGIAFSLFSDVGPGARMVLHMVIGVAVILIAWMLVGHSRRGKVPALAFGLILGGAVGNLIDRIVHGWVVDFVHVWVHLGDKTYAWPDFNVADSAITTGACLFVLYEIIDLRASSRGDTPSDSSESDTAAADGSGSDTTVSEAAVEDAPDPA